MWLDLHRQSEKLASEGYQLARAGHVKSSIEVYRQAANLELRAAREIDRDKIKTVGIIALSAVSLLYKAQELSEAENSALEYMRDYDLPEFIRDELRIALQTIWMEKSKKSAGVQFHPGQVLVSIKGASVIVGGAPLDLILDKVQAIQSLFFRTIEFVHNLPHRRHGSPSKDIQSLCRPWLFQAPPGSYQFSVAIQEMDQPDLFKEDFSPVDIATRFLDIVAAAASDNHEALDRLVPQSNYKSTFLKLSRNLAPTGKALDHIELRRMGESNSVELTPSSRAAINSSLKSHLPRNTDESDESLRGVLRAVHLDKSWLDLVVDVNSVHIIGLKDTVDDVIGPMVNRNVIVTVRRTSKGKFLFRDIELDE